MQEVRAPFPPGTLIAGKYRVERVLGAGGMGIVLAAEHVQLHQRVAIKLVRNGALDGAVAIERFVREARAAVRLRTDHVARVLDVGTLADGSPFMVMEYLEGRDLAEVLSREGPLSVELAASYLVQACEALAEAHAMGIVHRDLKPQNLFLTKAIDGRPFVKVLDFGVSKVASTLGTHGLTVTSALMGSPLYMSPEQLHSARSATPRSDIWALGVVLYELVTGRLPFEAGSMPELCLKVVAEEPVPARRYRADLPVALEALIARCLEKDPARRFGDVADLAAALAPFAPEEARSSVERARLIAAGLRLTDSAGERAPSVRVGSSVSGVTSSRPIPRAHGLRRRWLLAGSGALASAIVVGILLSFAHAPRAVSTSASATIESAAVPPEPPRAPDASAPSPSSSSVAPPSAAPPPPPIAPRARSTSAPRRTPPRTTDTDDIPSLR